ncbi:MAG: hypothetical protein ACYC2K_13205 [Gemmatimonadales bacterium]
MTANQSDPRPSSQVSLPSDDDALRIRVAEICTEGWAVWDRFAENVMERPFHPFVAADYDAVSKALWPFRRQGLRFLEWGSATGVITIMADILGFEAYGIELDSSLNATALELAKRFESKAKFAAGSFLPTGYRWKSADGDTRTGTLGTGPSSYAELGHPLDEFDVVFGFPWDGEEPMMLDLMKTYGRADALLLLNNASHGIRAYRGGRDVTSTTWPVRG